MALLNVQKISMGLNAAGSYLGLVPAFVAAVGPDTFINRDNRTFLAVKNGGGGAITVTIDSKVKCNQGHEHDVAVSVTNGSEIWIGPFSPVEFSDGSTDIVTITYSGITSVTVAVFSLSSDGRP